MFEYLYNGMDPLDVVIIKWEETRDEMSSAEPHTCALCETNGTCSTCVVAMYTGVGGCHKTPYTDYYKKQSKYNAGRMVAFLQSLRTNK